MKKGAKIKSIFTRLQKFLSRNCPAVLVALLIFATGIFLRLYHIEFGLPHSFHADEPEISEFAVKYTYEFRDIIQNRNYYKLIPVSYVYGTFPTYLLTAALMAFSKTSNFLGTSFDKTSLFIYLRTVTSLSSFLIVPTVMLAYYRTFRDRRGVLVAGFLAALNWKFIVHAHYVNADIILTVVMTLAFVCMIMFYEKKSDTLYTTLAGLLFGFAVGTKITAFLSLPLFLYLFLVKKQYREMFAFTFLIFAGFAISNPFSLIFATDFVFRVYMMTVKEAGMVFDSVDSNPFKYLSALAYISTLPVLILAVVGKLQALSKYKDRRPLHIFLVGNVLIYLMFYSFNMRNVDRWLLPILPVVLLYASYGIVTLKNKLSKPVVAFLALVTAVSYLYFPILLTSQFQRHTPKSAAYVWLRDNVSPQANKLAITEEGLDPLNKLNGILVKRFDVYESQAAQFSFPPSPDGYDYVILASKPMKNYKKPEVIKKFPFYTKAWEEFEEKVMDATKFTLVKKFELPKPNLINLSDVYIYRSTNSRL